jgi:hypothetical protein
VCFSFTIVATVELESPSVHIKRILGYKLKVSSFQPEVLIRVYGLYGLKFTLSVLLLIHHFQANDPSDASVHILQIVSFLLRAHDFKSLFCESFPRVSHRTSIDIQFSYVSLDAVVRCLKRTFWRETDPLSTLVPVSFRRTGPDGPKTLCNRCGVYWATMRHKWDNLVARFKGDSHTKTRGTPATNGGGEEEEGATGVSVPRGRKPGKGKVTDPTPTSKVSREFKMNSFR